LCAEVFPFKWYNFLALELTLAHQFRSAPLAAEGKSYSAAFPAAKCCISCASLDTGQSFGAKLIFMIKWASQGRKANESTSQQTGLAEGPKSAHGYAIIFHTA